MTSIENLFEKDIFRDIKGVVKVGQHSAALRFQEVDEYVVTRELRRHLHHFFDDYAASLATQTDKNGVWISGFFGSGKSHFLKILSYLLTNRNITDPQSKQELSVIEAFQPKIKDTLFMADLRKCAQVPTDVILFNIDSKADSDSKNDKEAIVKVFLRVFNENLGYCTKSFHVAELERTLDQRGKLAEFNSHFNAIYDRPWQEARNDISLLTDELSAALSKTLDMSAEAALRWHDNLEKEFRISIDDFSKLVKNYLDARGPKHRIVFMIDEVGQYIGENRDLMLNLQTVAEDLGTACGARAWVMVTSQESMEHILDASESFRSNDFSKIQGRFATRLNLSSAHADEVIQRRLLAKTDAAQASLRLLWQRYGPDLDNLYSFDGGAELKSYADEADFLAFYPFVPFQFKMLQRTLETIRKMGDTGRHIAKGERSLLDAAQQALKANSSRELNTLIPYPAFFKSLETFLTGRIRRVFETAESNSFLDDLAKQVLRTLFLVKYIEEFKATVDNIATLHIHHIEQDKLKLKQDIATALKVLEHQFLVQRVGDSWSFLTDEEQDINRHIELVPCGDRETLQVIGKTIVGDIWRDKKYRYQNEKDFNWSLVIDNAPVGSGQEELKLEVITPLHPDHQSLQKESTGRMLSADRFLWVMGEDGTFIKEARAWYRTEQYTAKKFHQAGTAAIRAILSTRKEENAMRKLRLVELITKALQASTVYIHGTRQPVSGETTNMLNQGLEKVVEAKFTKYRYAGKVIRDAGEVDRVLRQGFEGELSNPFQAAEEDMALHVGRKHSISVADLLLHFAGIPYGWNLHNTLLILARLLHTGRLQLEHLRQPVSHRAPGMVTLFLNKKKSGEYTVAMRQSAGADVIQTLRGWVVDFYGRAQWPSDEIDFGAEIRQCLDKTKSTWQGWCDELSSAAYPAQKRMQAALNQLDEILNQSNDVAMLRNLRQLDLNHWLDLNTNVASFFTGQHKHWDKAKATLADYQALPQHLQPAELEETSNQIQTILAERDPWSMIQRLPMLEVALGKHLQALFSEEKSALTAQIQTAMADWQTRHPGLPGECTQPLAHLLRRVQAGSRVQEIRAMKADLAYAQSQVRQHYNRHIDAQQTRTEQTQTPVAGLHKPRPPAKKYRKLDLTQAVTGMTRIENEADKVAFLAALSDYLDEALQQNFIVEL